MTTSQVPDGYLVGLLVAELLTLGALYFAVVRMTRSLDLLREVTLLMTAQLDNKEHLRMKAMVFATAMMAEMQKHTVPVNFSAA